VSSDSSREKSRLDARETVTVVADPCVDVREVNSNDTQETCLTPSKNVRRLTRIENLLSETTELTSKLILNANEYTVTRSIIRIGVEVESVRREFFPKRDQVAFMAMRLLDADYVITT